MAKFRAPSAPMSLKERSRYVREEFEINPRYKSSISWSEMSHCRRWRETKGEFRVKYAVMESKDSDSRFDHSTQRVIREGKLVKALMSMEESCVPRTQKKSSVSVEWNLMAAASGSVSSSTRSSLTRNKAGAEAASR